MQPEDRPRLLDMLASLAITLVMVWATLPPEDRRWLTLRLAHHSRRALAALAEREGRAGMSDELAGGRSRAASRYNVAYWLSVGRDRLAEALRP